MTKRTQKKQHPQTTITITQLSLDDFFINTRRTIDIRPRLQREEQRFERRDKVLAEPQLYTRDRRRVFNIGTGVFRPFRRQAYTKCLYCLEWERIPEGDVLCSLCSFLEERRRKEDEEADEACLLEDSPLPDYDPEYDFYLNN